MDKNSELVSLSHLVLTTFGFSLFLRFQPPHSDSVHICLPAPALPFPIQILRIFSSLLNVLIISDYYEASKQKISFEFALKSIQYKCEMGLLSQAVDRICIMLERGIHDMDVLAEFRRYADALEGELAWVSENDEREVSRDSAEEYLAVVINVISHIDELIAVDAAEEEEEDAKEVDETNVLGPAKAKSKMCSIL